MMDVSDGLAKDLGALTPCGAVADLDLSSLPRRAGASVRSALSEGEDYELVFSVAARADLPLDQLEDARLAVDEALTVLIEGAASGSTVTCTGRPAL